MIEVHPKLFVDPSTSLRTRIKKEKPLLPIGEDEKPYDLPQGWEWVRVKDLSQNIHYGFTASADPSINDFRLLRITDIQNDKVNWYSVPGCEISSDNAQKYLLKDNDILIARTGGTIGKSYIVKNINVNAVFASYLIRIIPVKSIFSNYIKLFLGSFVYWNQLYANSMGTGQPNVNGVALSNLKFSLPPFEEQKRIVAKVDALMQLCDGLESQLSKSQQKSERLMNAVVQGVIIGQY